MIAGKMVVSALIFIAVSLPAEAATAGKIAGTNQITLDPEKGDLRASLTAVANATGIKIIGDSPMLAEAAATGPITGTTEQVLQRLLHGRDCIIKIDKAGQVREVVIPSGKRSRDPLMQAATPLPAGKQMQTAAGPSISPVTSALMAKAEQSKVRPMISASTRPEPIPRIPTGGAARTAASAPVAGGQPPAITPEMQAQIAASTRLAQSQLSALVQQLKAACPAGQRC